MSGLTPAEFARKWIGNERTERAASQEHFIDLCRMLGVPTPNEADPTGEDYAFEKGASKSTGGEGFADVWRRGHFAWEYKGRHKDLRAAYQQLLQYREALDNPPLLVVCDLDRLEIHTNFSNTPAVVHSFDLQRLLTDPSEPLRWLRAVMQHPEELKPGKTRDELTAEAATEFASLAERLHARGHEPHAVAHFLNKLLFCMFAEDAGLLPGDLIERLARAGRDDPEVFASGARSPSSSTKVPTTMNRRFAGSAVCPCGSAEPHQDDVRGSRSARPGVAWPTTCNGVAPGNWTRRGRSV